MTKNNRTKHYFGAVQILLGASCFGLIPIFVRFGKDISTLDLVFFRAFFGVFFIFIMAKFHKMKLVLRRNHILKTIIWSIILLLAIASYFYSLKKIDITSATLLLSLSSFFIVILSNLLLAEKIYLNTFIALIFSLVGTIFVISSPIHINSNLIGCLAAISAAFWTGLNFIFPKIYFSSSDVYSLTFFQSLFQIPLLFPFFLISPPVFNTGNLIIFSCLGLFCTAFAFILIYSGSKNVKGQYIGLLQSPEFIIPIILSYFIFKEPLHHQVIIGGIFLVISYLLIVASRKKVHES